MENRNNYMKNSGHVKDILDAIKSVKSRAHAALKRKDQIHFLKLAGDLYALEACLVIEAEALLVALNEQEKHAA